MTPTSFSGMVQSEVRQEPDETTPGKTMPVRKTLPAEQTRELLQFAEQALGRGVDPSVALDM